MALLVANAGGFMTSSLNVALPAINQEFKPTAVVLNWVITAFILSWGVFSIPTGRLADIFGLRRLTIIGSVIFLVGMTAAIFSNSITMLIMMRAFQGIGAAILAGTLVAILTITFPAKERGWALGIYTSSVYFWLSAGPFVGGILTEYLNWRSLFIFNIPFALAILVLVLWKVKTEWASAQGEKFDFTGSVIFGLALTGIIYGFSQIREVFGMILTAAGIAGAVFFIYWEYHARSPLLNLRELGTNRPFLFANLASVITYSATSGTAFLLSLYLQLVKGFSPIQASWILIIQPVIQTVFALFAG
ncbi:MAG TPA: MFS transporter, partial [Dehalococcoidales bacterium]|nr:MFS transporter [Dehalococcoidales bacterium]